MTPEQRAELLGNDLTKAVDETVAAFACTPEQALALGNLLAATLGRVTERASSKVLEQYQLIERVSALERARGGGS